MTLDDLLFDIHVLEYELQSFERRFGVLSEMFYEVWSQGEEPADSSWVLPWAAWAGAYESWRDYRSEYMQATTPNPIPTSLNCPVPIRTTNTSRPTSNTTAFPRPVSPSTRPICLF